MGWGVCSSARAYQVEFESLRGRHFHPTRAQTTRVLPQEQYLSRPQDREVGTLTLIFSDGEISNDRARLQAIAGEEAAAVGANLALQESVAFNTRSGAIRKAVYHCLLTELKTSKKD